MIHEAPDPIPKKNKTQDDAEEITTWCCCNQGVSTMGVSFNKVSFTPDEVAVAKISINNGACKVKCESVTLKLVNLIHFEDSAGEVFSYEKVLQKEVAIGPEAGDSTWEKTMDINLKDIRFKIVEEKVNKSGLAVNVAKEDKYLAERLPPKTKQSRYFKIRYSLQVETTYAGKTFCSETPFVTTPLNVVGKINPDSYGYEAERDQEASTSYLGFRRIKCEYVDEKIEY
jgi:hypothetical protein